MLSIAAAEYAHKAPWVMIYPGLAISLDVFGTNLLGDALRSSAARVLSYTPRASSTSRPRVASRACNESPAGSTRRVAMPASR